MLATKGVHVGGCLSRGAKVTSKKRVPQLMRNTRKITTKTERRGIKTHMPHAREVLDIQENYQRRCDPRILPGPGIPLLQQPPDRQSRSTSDDHESRRKSQCPQRKSCSRRHSGGRECSHKSNSKLNMYCIYLKECERRRKIGKGVEVGYSQES